MINNELNMINIDFLKSASVCSAVRNNQECLNGIYFDKSNNAIVSTNRHVIYKADCDLQWLDKSIIIPSIKIPAKSAFFSLEVEDDISYGVTFYDDIKSKILTLFVDIIQSDYVNYSSALINDAEINETNVIGMSPEYLSYIKKVFPKSEVVCFEIYNDKSCIYISCESRPNEKLGIMPCAV